MKKEKLFYSLLNGSYNNISFSDIVGLDEAFGFDFVRKQGSHNFYKHSGMKELINLQNYEGKTKPYQIRQFLKLVEKYNLKLGE